MITLYTERFRVISQINKAATEINAAFIVLKYFYLYAFTLKDFTFLSIKLRDKLLN